MDHDAVTLVPQILCRARPGEQSTLLHNLTSMRRYQQFFNPAAASHPLDVSVPLSVPFLGDAVFVSIDYEAACSTKPIEEKKITEFGISWLDTRDLQGAVPRDRGCSLRRFINDVHIIIDDNMTPGHGLPGKCPRRWHKGNVHDKLFCRSQLVRSQDVGKAIIGLFRSMETLNTARTGVRHGASSPRNTWTPAGLLWAIDQFRTAVAIGLSLPHVTTRKYFFVFHDPREDIKALKTLGIDLLEAFRGSSIIDTQCSILCNHMQKARPSLQELLLAAGVPHRDLHNGSNDARFTLEAFLAMVFMTKEQERNFGILIPTYLPVSWPHVATSQGQGERQVYEARSRNGYMKV